jgi:peptidoglycan/LPS O-acetylase OafA/YrhL
MPRDARWVTATVVLTLIASTCSWYLVEKPALKLKDWRLASLRDTPQKDGLPAESNDAKIAA